MTIIRNFLTRWRPSTSIAATFLRQRGCALHGYWISFRHNAPVCGCDFVEDGVDFDGERYWQVLKCRRCGTISPAWTSQPPSHCTIRDIRRVPKDKYARYYPSKQSPAKDSP